MLSIIFIRYPSLSIIIIVPDRKQTVFGPWIFYSNLRNLFYYFTRASFLYFTSNYNNYNINHNNRSIWFIGETTIRDNRFPLSLKGFATAGGLMQYSVNVRQCRQSLHWLITHRWIYVSQRYYLRDVAQCAIIYILLDNIWI